LRIEFANVQRGRPLVLTEHDVRKLSLQAGRDVEPELRAMCEGAYQAKTFGQLLRELSAALQPKGDRA
jgi:hypothetical protein